MDKVQKTLAEIDGSGGKTMSQIIDLLIGERRAEQSAPPQSADAGEFSFDMKELEQWREKNNRLFRVEYYRNIVSYRKRLSGLVVFVKRIIRKMMRSLIEPIVQDQNEFNGSVTASINALYNNARVSQEFMKRAHADSLALRDLAEKYGAVHGRVGALEERHAAYQGEVEAKLALLDDKAQKLHDFSEAINEAINKEIARIESQNKESAESLTKYIEQLTQDTSQLARGTGRLAQETGKLTADTDRLTRDMAQLAQEMEESELNILRAIKKRSETPEIAPVVISYEINGIPSVNQNDEKNIYDEIDYFNFENHFRGLRRNIMNSQRQYLSYFEDKRNVVDLGCGRGEFLEVLKQNHVEATGVDTYQEFVDYCGMKGLTALKDDAVAYVAGLPDESIDGLFAAQLAEHLETEQLIALCNKAYEKLKPGSFFILETPNPTCLSIYTNSFYLDPSHVKPVHPKTLSYFLQEAGFKNIEVKYTEQSKVDYRFPLLVGSNIENLAQFNDGINFLSDIMFGSQDYAVIAQK